MVSTYPHDHRSCKSWHELAFTYITSVSLISTCLIRRNSLLQLRKATLSVAFFGTKNISAAAMNPKKAIGEISFYHLEVNLLPQNNLEKRPHDTL